MPLEDFEKRLKIQYISQLEFENIDDISWVVNQCKKRLNRKYFNDKEPRRKKDNKMRLNTIVYVSLEIIRKISILLYPIIPQTALKALSIFNIKEKDIKFATILNNKYLSSEDSINKIEILFNKISK